MINPVQDAVFPLETSQKPLFGRLGSELNQHLQLPGGHGVFNTYENQVVREILAWLDTYIGPVN